MQIEIKENEYCELAVHYEAEAEEIEGKRNDVLNIFKKAPVPGFRSGKANIEVVKIHYKSQINDALKRALAEDAFHNTLFDKNLKPFGTPEFHNMMLNNGRFICDFSMRVKPSFTLLPYKDIEVPKPAVKSVNEIAEEMLQQLRVKFGKYDPYEEDDFVTENDNIIINYNAFVDGQKVDTISADGEMITVGTSDLKEFDLNLLGMKLGETRRFDITAPQNSLPSLSGKVVTFEVTVCNGSKIHPCGLDDELAKKFNKNTFEELHKGVMDSANARANHISKSTIAAHISHKLMTDHDFKVPEWLVLAEAKHLSQQAAKKLLPWETVKDEDKEEFLKKAFNNVKLSLILDEIRENEPDAQLSDQEALEMVRDALKLTNPELSTDDVIKQMGTNGHLQALFVGIRNEYVLDFLIQHAKIIE